MNGLYNWWLSLSQRFKTSVSVSAALVGAASTIMSIIGVTVKDYVDDLRVGIALVALAFVVLAGIVFRVIGVRYRDSVSLIVRGTPVTVKLGDLFKQKGLKVIGCDSRFDTRVDDIVIAKRSLHGQFVLKHGNVKEIRATVEKEAIRRDISADEDGLYRFPLGTVIRYDSTVDGETYLLLAVSELDANNEAHTNMAEFERTLMKMWREIYGKYALNPVVLPLLGSGILRFDDGPKERESLLRCLLCTLNASGVALNTDVSVVIYGNANDIPLYEYRDMFRLIPGKLA